MSDKQEYNIHEAEEKWYAFWQEKGYFNASVKKDKKPYTIVIPPPNVTGVLHMGHGLNNTLQDILIRFKRMSGFEACWVPGTDHAGIATQNVVEKSLLKEKKQTRDQVGREEFLKKVWAWKEENGNTIIEQLKKIGSSCDWSRTRFTMDEGLSKAVREVFVRLYDKGLIYRGNYIVNWCPRCTTALADDEVEHTEHQHKLFYLKYPMKDSKEFVIVATTRPETMLGDTGVAVNPGDKRYKKLAGKKVILPLAGREIPVIQDKIVDKEFGTGVVKVTPSHDPNDFEMGKTHKLEFINIMDEKGVMNDNVPEKYRGMDRFECRKRVLEDLEELGLVEKIEDYTHSVGHCYRCDTVIEPYQSTQWFVKMKPLAEPAIKAVEKGDITFLPARWKKVYLNWMNNIRDWCISRQIWWGHRIPVWYCEDCQEMIVKRENPKNCPKCKSSTLKQDPDVLDTWFSSWLWPFSTLGWPEEVPDLDYFYPTNVLVTDPGIIFFWVARMIIAGMEFMGKIPFSDVHIHGVVLDSSGRKMSKSLGNGIDPLDVVKQYGADSLRYTMIAITPSGQNLLLSMDKFTIGKFFVNKIYNASRYILMNYEKQAITEDISSLELELADKWILSKLNSTIYKINDSLKKYRFQEYALTYNDFFWHQFCDWYVEMSKVGLYKSDDKIKNKTLSVLFYVLRQALKLFHPVMPFITEEIFQELPNKDAESIMISAWPEADKKLIDTSIEDDIEVFKRLVTAIRNIRSLMNIPPVAMIDVILSTKDKRKRELIKQSEKYIQFLAKVEKIELKDGPVKIEEAGVNVTDNIEIFVPLKGLIEVDKEKARLDKMIGGLKQELQNIDKKLKNKNFVEKAKKEAVDKVHERKAKIMDDLKLLEKNMAGLGS
ncbi:MAG: valine--tRNA ligase [Spirochaetes bacterium]|nr:valine--tRNA ligase [Spirochaetota bacterium]